MRIHPQSGHIYTLIISTCPLFPYYLKNIISWFHHSIISPFAKSEQAPSGSLALIISWSKASWSLSTLALLGSLYYITSQKSPILILYDKCWHFSLICYCSLVPRSSNNSQTHFKFLLRKRSLLTPESLSYAAKQQVFYCWMNSNKISNYIYTFFNLWLTNVLFVIIIQSLKALTL